MKKETNPEEANCAVLCHSAVAHPGPWYFPHTAAVLWGFS